VLALAVLGLFAVCPKCLGLSTASDRVVKLLPPVAVSSEETIPAAAPVVPAPHADQVIDLPTALGLAGASNPTIALAQEAVRASQAEQLQADALLLPTLRAGASFDLHRGNLQSSRGIIEDVDRQSLYAGGGNRCVMHRG
jgi:outer membrane protein TolC